MAGLNALFAASRYLASDQKVILVDRRERLGGMWVDTYPYVRLHQPHGLFTAGNIDWTLGQDRGYLARRPEVLDHFEHCLNVIKQRVRVDELFGWTLRSDEETNGVVRITCTSSVGEFRVIETKRLIKAYGLRIAPNDPLRISSKRVRSVSPDFCDMEGEEIRASHAPVWIIGGGKTAMDTAHALITGCPGREVNLVAGSGTFFAQRDRLFPARRWWRGSLASTAALGLYRRFDGTNEVAVADWYRTKYGTFVTPNSANFLLGSLSKLETETIINGLNHVIMDYVVDAVDRNDVTNLIFRSGATKAITPGSWIVNCTGYVLRGDHPYEPYASDSGAIASIQMRSATFHLTTTMGYYMSHLMFLEKLRDIPLYELDAQELRRKSATALTFTMLTLAGYNLSLIYDCVPANVLSECGLDLDRWYPLPRRVIGGARYVSTIRRDRDLLRRALDTVRDRFEIRCGPLSR